MLIICIKDNSDLVSQRGEQTKVLYRPQRVKGDEIDLLSLSVADSIPSSSKEKWSRPNLRSEFKV